MSSLETLNSSESENLCVVCFKNVEIYSVGVCDHPVCFECSTRMRVLCRQNECPICRRDMPKVIFTKNVEPFSELFQKFERSNLQDRKFGVYFCTSDIQKAYYKLLEHRCMICEDHDRKWPFKTFAQLKDHMRKYHELFYCDICSDNLKIFSFERRAYNRQELGLHRRKGDPDNTSHRGHPLCEFCDERFMDNDELFRHLRRNHLFCHFCDADGKHQYYNTIDDLKKHFVEEHYLCQEGECKAMPLTAVFRTDIDLKVHIASEHSRHMSKSATKQARTLELEFTLAPRPRNDNSRNKSYDNRRDRPDEEGAVGYNMEPGGPGGGNEPQNRLFVNPLTSEEFPALGNASTSLMLHPRPTTVNFHSKVNPFNKEQFPSLGGSSNRPSSAVTITTNSAPRTNRAPEVTITRTVRGQQGLSRNSENFPALGPASSSSNGGSTVRLSVNNSSQDSKAPKVSIHVNHKPNGAITTHITTNSSSTLVQQKPTEAFPALGKSTKVSQPQWVQQKPKKQEPKPNKVAAAPSLTPRDFTQFPSLSKQQSSAKNKNESKSKKSSSVTVPVSNNWINLKEHNSARTYSSNNVGAGDVQTRNSTSKEKLSNNADGTLINNESENKNKNKKKKNKNSNPELSALDTNPKNTKMNKSPEVSSVSDLVDNIKTNDDSDNKDSGEVGNNDIQNGFMKKRSELKIGTLNSGENQDTLDDFPVLGGTKPPPGFLVKPPPGFNNPQNYPALGVSNDLTFTNSSGESYSITPNNGYKQPNNFITRNQNLIKKFMCVSNNNEAIKEFKNYSDLFRQGVLPAEKYYEHCKSVLVANFDEFFPEMLVLLPDIEKQQQLFSVSSEKVKKNLVQCQKCKQVIFKKELTEHYTYHNLDNHFPTLGKATHVNNVWKK